MKAFAYLSILMGCLSCASPKYSYDFGQPPAAAVTRVRTENRRVPEVPEFEATIVYSPVATPKPRPATQKVKTSQVVEVSASAEVKAQVSSEVPPISAKSMDGDLKRSAIFLVGGTVALIIGGDVFVVAGSLALLIGLIFGIKWALRK